MSAAHPFQSSWSGCSVSLPGGGGAPLATLDGNRGDGRPRARVDHGQRRVELARRLAREQARALFLDVFGEVPR